MALAIPTAWPARPSHSLPAWSPSSTPTMRAGRPYRAPFSRDEAIRELESGAGRQFDPALLDLLPALRKCDIDF